MDVLRVFCEYRLSSELVAGHQSKIDALNEQLRVIQESLQRADKERRAYGELLLLGHLEVWKLASKGDFESAERLLAPSEHKELPAPTEVIPAKSRKGA